MRNFVALAVVAASGLTTPAWACSMLNWNVYESYSEPALARLADEAASIDRVSIEPPAPPSCPRLGDHWSVAEPEATLEAPLECYEPSHAPANAFVARVVERLKGASPDRYALSMLQPAWHDGEEWREPYWYGFSDLRGVPLFTEVSVRANERRIARGRHRQAAFWDRGASPFRNDMSNSCGGGPTLDPSMQYLAFRDVHGAITAVEPVAHADDALLVRLRARREGGDVDLRQAYPVEDFFRTAAGVVQTRVARCHAKGSSYEGEKATLTVERGDPAFIYATQSEAGDGADAWYEHGRSGSRTFDFDDLPDFFALRGEACPVGGSVLIVRIAFPEPDEPAFDAEWVEAEYPGWLETVPAEWRDVLAGRGELYAGPDRPIRVGADGSVKLGDIPTAFRLTGPDTVTVDQIFRWFEEGRAASPAPSSS